MQGDWHGSGVDGEEVWSMKQWISRYLDILNKELKTLHDMEEHPNFDYKKGRWTSRMAVGVAGKKV